MVVKGLGPAVVKASLLLLLLCGSLNGNFQREHRNTFDFIEDHTLINQPFNQLRQLIFWQWDQDNEAYIACAWCYIPLKEKIFISRDRHGHKYILFNHQDAIKQIWFRQDFITSKTDWDPEAENAKLFPVSKLRAERGI